MKITILCTLVFMIGCIGILSVPAHESDSHRVIDHELWGAQLVTFQKLLKTAPDDARAELQNVGKKIFEKHTLVSEWVPLYFRLSLEGTEHPSDIKRVHELELRMLTAIDAEKYADQIQHHREALEDAEALAAAIGKDHPIPKKTGQEPVAAETPNADIAHQHYKKFHERLPHDVDAARKELDAFAALAFQGHPRTGEWKALFFQYSLEKECTVAEMLAFLELKKQMLKDIDASRHAQEIKGLDSALKQLTSISKIFEKQGTLATEKVSFDMAPKD